MTEFEKIARVLAAGGVKFIVIGGWAAIFHGLAHSTYDVDVVYSRDRENIRRLVEALKPLHPYLRGAPPGLPFVFDEKTVRNGFKFHSEYRFGEPRLASGSPRCTILRRTASSQ